MDPDQVTFASRLLLLPALLIAGGFAVMVATILRNGKVAELRHRERMAMIERGMTPPEPAGLAAAPRRAEGYRLTLGIMLCGLGLALGTLIGFAAGEAEVAFGVGGAFVMVGLAFVTTAIVTRVMPADVPPAANDGSRQG